MKWIELTKGMKTQVDDEDYEELSKYSWHAATRRATAYAERGGKKDGKACTVSMHRVITKAPKGKVVDHINGDGLDNRRENLRVCTYRENSRNMAHHRNGGVPCVIVSKNAPRYQVKGVINGRYRYVGSGKTYEEAVAVLRKYEAKNNINQA